MKRLHTWLGGAVLVMGMAVMPTMGQGGPDLSGPPPEQGQGQGRGQQAGPGGGRRFNGDRPHRPGDRMMDIMRQLNLTDDQKAEVREIMQANAGKGAEHRKEMKAAMDELKAAMESKDQDKIKAARQKVQQLREAGRTQLVSQLSAVLTDEQKARLQELMKREGPGGPEGRRDGPLEKLRRDLAKLQLTDDQQTQIKGIVQTHREAMEKFMTEHKDQMEQIRQKVRDAMQSKDREAAQAAREEMRTLMQSAPVKPKDLMEQIGKVLTDEQRRQLHQMMREQRREGRGPGGGEMGGPRRGRGGPGGPGGSDGDNPPPPAPEGGDQLDL
ncbi:MAG: Spy/CpxP family protein refolding chaperone [Phycisphaerales bacterium]